MARTATPIGRVSRARTAVRTIVTQRRPPLSNARFVTGTVVSRSRNSVVLRMQSGGTVTVLTQAVPVAASVLTAGSTVVLPVQYVNNGLVLVPAYTTADETTLGNEPMLAPCAVNDNDADDAGDTSYYAPPGACANNDADADDGYNFTIPALPNSFGSIPQAFSTSFAPVVAAGFVGPAMSSGAVNGSLTPGRHVVVYGYDFNNNLVATSLM